ASIKPYPWNITAHRLPSTAPKMMTGTDGSFIMSMMTTIAAGISMIQEMLNVSCRFTMVFSAIVRSPLPSVMNMPTTQYRTAAMMNAGTDTKAIDLICLNRSTFDNVAVITVVSESGDVLSPT